MIFWGPKWNTNALDYQAVEVTQENLVNQLAGTPYQRLLGQYADQTDFPHDDTALGGVWFDPATPPTITGNDADFATEAARASQINGWPNTADTDFIIYPQNGTSYTETKICGKHTDYHDSLTQNDFLAAYVKYGCQPTSTNVEDMTVFTSHEYAEMVTDPDTMHGWRAGSSGLNGEIGDLCDGQASTFGGGLRAQTEFDNKSGQCRMDADGQTSPPQSVRSVTMQVSPTSDGFITEPNRDHINMLNLEITTTNSAGNGLLVVYPAGQPAPRTTDINFTAGKTITQLVSIPLGVGGQVNFSATVGTEVIVDFLGVSYDGYFGGFATSHASDQARVADSRTPTAYCACRPIAPHSIGYAAFYNDINGNPTGVLAGTDGVSVHITALGPAGLGYLTAWPSVANVGAAIPPTNPGPPPGTTSVSFSAGISSGNDVIVAPAKDVNGQQYGYFAIYNGSSVTLNYLVDLHGYSTGLAPGRQTSISPVTRIEDTRSCGPLGGNLCGQLAPGAPTSFQVEGRGPTAKSGMANVLLHVSTLNSAGRGYVQVWNGGHWTAEHLAEPDRARSRGQRLDLRQGRRQRTRLHPEHRRHRRHHRNSRMGRQLIPPTGRPGHHRRRAGAVAVGLLLMAMAAAGCASTPHIGDASCGLYPLTLDQPQPLTRGQQVTIASRGYTCTGISVSGTESVYFNVPSSPVPSLGSAQVAPNGAFHITIRIPTDAPLGRALLVPDGPTRYVCTGTGASCGRYRVLVTISH